MRRRLLCVHRLLMHRGHLRLVLHVVHWVHEVLLVRRHSVLGHVLLGVHMVRHLLRLLQGGTTGHSTRRGCCRLKLARRVNCRSRRLVPIRAVAVCFGSHVTHLRWAIWSVAILFHLLIISQSVVGWEPWVWHSGRRLRRVMVLCWPELLVASLHLVPLLRHRAIVCVCLLVVVATTVPHVRHVGVGEICHTVAVIGAHRGPTARVARVRIFRRRFSANQADTITLSVTTQSLRIPFTTQR